MGEETGVALVTGASRGLGAVIARELAARGWAVAVNYHSDAQSAGHVVDDIRAAGGTALALPADVTDEAPVAELVEQVGRRLGPVDVLVINATGPQPERRVEELTWQAHLDQLVFFVKSPTLLVQAVLPSMRARGHGRIIQIGSDSVARALPGTSAYVAAKDAAGRPDPHLGPRAGAVRHHGQPRGTGLDPGGAARRHRRSRSPWVSGRSAAGPARQPGRRGRRRGVPGLGGGGLHHRRTDHRERRPHDLLTAAAHPGQGRAHRPRPSSEGDRWAGNTPTS